MACRKLIIVALLLTSSPAGAAAWQCDAPKDARRVYVRIEDGVFDVARGPPFEWRHLCRPSEDELARRCWRRNGKALASVVGVDGGDSYEFDVVNRRLTLRSWGMAMRVSHKLVCIELRGGQLLKPVMPGN